MPPPTAREIVTFDDTPPPLGESMHVPGQQQMTDLLLVESDPSWPAHYATLSEVIIDALGDRVLGLGHVGSTSVPRLVAKPVIDIDLTVADSSDEPAYVPALERRGFVLVVREPWWLQHRLLRRPEPACNLHVWPPNCAEPERHRIFRDWLRAHPDERALYAAAKLAAAEQTRALGGKTLDYNARKQPVVREIYGRAFRALGLLD